VSWARVGHADAVQKALNRLVDASEFGLVACADLCGPERDRLLPSLSNEVQPIQKRRATKDAAQSR
jgi:hypothetical protein